MAVNRVYAIVKRYLYHLAHDRWDVAEILYWPFLDIAVYGYLSAWVSRGGTPTSTPVLATVILWQSLVQANFAISKNAIVELYTAGVVPLFSTPLTIREWATACMILSAGVALFATLFCNIVAIFMFGYSLTSIGWQLIPIALNLFCAGMAVGLAATSLLFYFGHRVRTLAYILGWIFSLVSGAYYPVDVLPVWMQLIARCLPLSYIFDIIRNPEISGNQIIINLGVASILTITYVFLAIRLLEYLFSRTLRNGLVRLTY